DCTDLFQEGIIVPPVRLARDGVVNDDLLRVFFRNSRFPAMVQGDTRALMAAIRLGEKRLDELIGKVGGARLEDSFDQLVARTGRIVRQRLREAVPDGEYRFTDTVDNDGHGSGPIKLRYRLAVSADEVVFDVSESDD